MIPQDIHTIVPQIPGESNPAYKRLIIYLKKGFENLETLQTYLEKNEPKISVTYGTLRNDSSDNNWKERITKYYEIRDKELQEEMQQLFKQLNNHSIHDMQEFIQELQNTFHEIINRHQQNGEYQPSYLLKMFKDYIYCYREATEIYYINSRHKLEPENEPEEEITINEKIVEKDILNDDKMNERNNIIQNLLQRDDTR